MYTPLPTSQYIEKYPKAVSFIGLCESQYIDIDYIINNHFDKIHWDSIVSNNSAPLNTLRKYPNKTNELNYYYRNDVPLDNLFIRDLKVISSDIINRSNAPIDLIIRKYRHRLTNGAWDSILKHSDLPIEYLLNECKNDILVDRFSLLIIGDEPKIFRSPLCSHPNLPFERIFKDFPDNIDFGDLCYNINLPIDVMIRDYFEFIEWGTLCQNPNFPIKLLNDPKYRSDIIKHATLYQNEQLSFNKIDNVSELHDEFILNANRGYYTYLIESRLSELLLSL